MMVENIPGAHYPLATTGDVFAGISNAKVVTPFGLSALYNRPSGIARLDSSGMLPYIPEAPVYLRKSDGTVFGYGYGSGTESQVGNALVSAYNDSVSGDSIHLYSDALVAINLAKHNVDWYLDTNVNLKSSGNVPLFTDNSGQLSFAIGGFGNLIHSGNADLIRISNNNSIFDIHCQNLTKPDTNYNSVVYQKSGIFNLNCQDISGNGSVGLYWENGPMYVKCSRLRTSNYAAFPVYAALNDTGRPVGDMYVDAQEIYTDDSQTIAAYGAGTYANDYRVWIHGKQIIANNNTSTNITNGKVYIIAEKIIGSLSYVGSSGTILYVHSQKLSNSTNTNNTFNNGSSYIDIDEIDDSNYTNSFTPLFVVSSGVHNFTFQTINRVNNGDIFSVTGGTGNLLAGILNSRQSYFDLRSTVNGRLQVAPNIIYNTTKVTGSLVYLGSSGLLNSIKTVDGSGSGLDTDLVRGVTGQFPATRLIGLVPTGNQIPWFPTNSTTGLLPISSFGQSLLSGDAATATGLLGLGAATPIDSGAFQPSNSTLTGVANLSPTGNQFVAYRESTTPTLEPITNFGRNLVGLTGFPNGTRTNRVLFGNGSGTPSSNDNVFYDGGIFTLDNTNGFRITYGNDIRAICDDNAGLGGRLLLYDSVGSKHHINVTGVEFNTATGNVRFTVHGSGSRDLFSVKTQGNTVHIGTSGGTSKLNIMGGSAAYALDIIHPTLQDSRIKVYSNGSNGRLEATFHENTVGSIGTYISFADSYFCNSKTFGPGNFGIGANPTGNGGVSTLVLGQATAPTANVNDTINMWCADRTGGAGLASLFIKAENGTTHIIGDRVGIANTNPQSRLDVSGSFGAAIAVLTTGNSPYTPTISDYTLLCDCTSGNIIVRLPASTGVTRRIYNIKKIDSSAATVTISGNASELIDGSVAQTISSQWTTLSMQAFGTGWYII